ncbi:MAG TPA: DUF5362 family protein [Methanoregulaceae archaeon]|jgi:predicted membrane protein|nr:DUF5362 family protein [Methanoregulaceae archaeon]
MGFLRIILAMVLFVIGAVLCITIIGAIIGIPLILVGVYLLYSEQKNRSKEAVREGVKEALKDMDKKGMEQKDVEQKDVEQKIT